MVQFDDEVASWNSFASKRKKMYYTLRPVEDVQELFLTTLNACGKSFTKNNLDHSKNRAEPFVNLKSSHRTFNSCHLCL